MLRNRRTRTTQVAAGVAAVAMLATACGSNTEPSPGTGDESLPPVEGDAFEYWFRTAYTDSATQTIEDQIRAWGQERGIPVEPIPINANEMQTQIAAGLQAGTLPDMIDVQTDLVQLLMKDDELANLQDLYEEIGEEYGGWVQAVGTQETYPGWGFGIPTGVSGPVLLRRNDLLEEAGFSDPPKTWEEMVMMAEEAQSPPDNWGMGYALSNVGDTEIFAQEVIHDYGGRVADDAGETCTLDSPETEAAINFIVDAYNAGLFPQGATIWDGAGDNVAYQSGETIFMANPGSVYQYMLANDPELLESTRFSMQPGGPAMDVTQAEVTLQVVTADSPNKELAEDLIKYMHRPENIEVFYDNGLLGPALMDYTDFEIFSESPQHEGLTELALNGNLSSFPDVSNLSYAEFSRAFTIAALLGRVIIDGVSISDSIDRAQAECETIYASNAN